MCILTVRLAAGRRLSSRLPVFFPLDGSVRASSKGNVPMATKDLPRRGANYGITRVDDDKRRSHCWIVRIQRKRRYWQGYFSDRVYGGKTKALHAARAFRDEVLVSHLPMSRGQNASIRRTNNRSGVPGVFRRVDFETTTVGQVERASWIAYWTQVFDPEVRGNQSLSARQDGSKASTK